MRYQYGEAFEHLGIGGMGHQGALWCAMNSEGILVLMAHQNFVHRRGSQWMYEMPDRGQLPPRGNSATKSWDVIETYFEPDKPVILPIAVFTTDGAIRPDGTWEQSVFGHATGDAYRARMQTCNARNGHLLCHIDTRFSY